MLPAGRAHYPARVPATVPAEANSALPPEPAADEPRLAADQPQSAADEPESAAAKPGPAAVPAGRNPGIDPARLRVAVLRLSRRLRKHDLAGLTPSQLSTLATIGQYGPVRLGDLAAAERIAPSTLTRLISVLEGLGYVRREAAPADARAFLVTVTEQGQQALERIRLEATSLLTDILLTLPPDQLEALADALPALEQLAGSG
jgi:DNA-binding MarR family transcriptional regulator